MVKIISHIDENSESPVPDVFAARAAECTAAAILRCRRLEAENRRVAPVISTQKMATELLGKPSPSPFL